MFGTSPETFSPAQYTKCGPDNANLTKSPSLADFSKAGVLLDLDGVSLRQLKVAVQGHRRSVPAEPVKRVLASHAHLKFNTRTEAVTNSHKTVNREPLEFNSFVCARGRPRLYGSLCSLIRSRATARGFA